MKETWDEFKEELEADLKQIKKSYESRTKIRYKIFFKKVVSSLLVKSRQ